MIHRQARLALGSRAARRADTKTKAISGHPGAGNSGGNDPQYRYFRYQGATRPRARVARMLSARYAVQRRHKVVLYGDDGRKVGAVKSVDSKLRVISRNPLIAVAQGVVVKSWSCGIDHVRVNGVLLQ